MNTFEVVDIDDLEHLHGILEEEGDQNRVECLMLMLDDGDCQTEEYRDLLWQVLSHPSADIRKLELEEIAPRALDESGAMKLVRRWCEEIPARAPREIRFSSGKSEGKSNHVAPEDLHRALICPNNCVQKLEIDCPSPYDRICEKALRPILDHPNNQLLSLTVKHLGLTDGETEVLSSAFASPNCKLKSLKLLDADLPLGQVMIMMEGLEKADSLERLVWRDSNDSPFASMWSEDIMSVATRLGYLLERPGNKLRSFRTNFPNWYSEHVTKLAMAIISEHCRLEELFVEWGIENEAVALPLLVAIRHPNNRLKALTMWFRGVQVATALGESLEDPNCKLVSLTAYGRDKDVGEVIVDALTRPNRLRKLDLDGQQPAVFQALARSLLSPNNKLTDLSCSSMQKLDGKTEKAFHRAVRVSNVVHLGRNSQHPFRQAFNSPFLPVFRTLLSLRLVPRLGKAAWVRLLPIQDLILSIAETLEWPLDDLR